MFKKPLDDHKVPLGKDKDSYNRGYTGASFDPSADDYFSHRDGRARAEAEDNAWLENFKRDDRDDEPSYSSPTPTHSLGAGNTGDGGFIGNLAITLLFWPIVTFFVAAWLPIRLTGEAPGAGFLRRLTGLLVAPFYGLGVVCLLLIAWVMPAMWAIGEVSGVAPGGKTTLGWVLACFAVFLITPAWAWLLDRGIELLRTGQPSGRIGLPLGAFIGIVAALGAAMVAAPFIST